MTGLGCSVCPVDIAALPPPPPGRTGWPWTIGGAQGPERRPDGAVWPRITIVTPSYNQAEFIEETIRSILLQGYPNLEYFVMDGGSTDGTVVILRKYDQWLTHWGSGPDGGQADAINKGLEKATGQWFQNINSDDVLLPHALFEVGKAPLDAEMVCGDVIEFGDQADYVVPNTDLTVHDMLALSARSPTKSWHQPGIFLRTERMRELGGYPSTLHYCFDLHLLVRYREICQKVFFTKSALTRFRIHSTAKSSSWQEVYIRESIEARDMLARTLRINRHRRMAALEAARRRLWIELGRVGSDKTGTSMRAGLRLIKSHPWLIFDRMFLGSLKNRWTACFRAIFAAD